LLAAALGSGSMLASAAAAMVEAEAEALRRDAGAGGARRWSCGRVDEGAARARAGEQEACV